MRVLTDFHKTKIQKRCTPTCEHQNIAQRAAYQTPIQRAGAGTRAGTVCRHCVLAELAGCASTSELK
eukprot:11678142-Alexandrium_andersonii.AAC.1